VNRTCTWLRKTGVPGEQVNRHEDRSQVAVVDAAAVMAAAVPCRPGALVDRQRLM